MTHKHDLLRKERYEFLPPRETLKQLMLQPGDTVADIGCGTGFFSLPAAKLVGDNGLVYAVDIEEEMLTTVQNRSTKKGITNLQTLSPEKAAIELESKQIDFLLLSNILHEIDNKKNFLRRYLPKLAPSGRLAVIEWKEKSGEVGPPVSHRMKNTAITNLLTNLNLTIVRELNLNSDQLGIVAKK